MHVEGTTLLVCTGLRKQQRKMRDAHVAKGIPWISFDLPHVRSKVGDVRLFSNTHDWLPSIEGWPSRFDRLGVTLPEGNGTSPPAKKRGRKKKGEPKLETEAVAESAPVQSDGYALVIGQVPRDSSHEMSEGELTQWASGVIEDIRRELPGVEVVWRPHPKAGRGWNYSPKGFDRMDNPTDTTLEQSLAGARVVCVYGSTVGVDALIAGKPVVAYGPSVYRDVVNKPSELATAKVADPVELRDLFEHLAYLQWGLDELATGEPFRFLFSQLGIPCTVTMNYPARA